MTSQQAVINKLKTIKDRLRQAYHVTKISLFGSVARNEATAQSDVDLVLEFAEPIGWDLVTLAEELETLLACKVDAIPRDAIKPRLWAVIEKDLVDV